MTQKSLVAILIASAVFAQGRRGGNNPFPGGTNPDGSLRPTPPVMRLSTQDAYAEYAILEPGSESKVVIRARKAK